MFLVPLNWFNVCIILDFKSCCLRFPKQFFMGLFLDKVPSLVCYENTDMYKYVSLITIQNGTMRVRLSLNHHQAVEKRTFDSWILRCIQCLIVDMTLNAPKNAAVKCSFFHCTTIAYSEHFGRPGLKSLIGVPCPLPHGVFWRIRRTLSTLVAGQPSSASVQEYVSFLVPRSVYGP